MSRNAGDRKEQAQLERLERRRLNRWKQNLGAVMNTPEGRAVMWTLLRRAGVYSSVFNTHGGVLNYNVGRQDYGHELIAEILKLGDEPYLAMEREGRAADARDLAEAESHQTESSQRREE
jgi:hypothetical protein